MKFSLAFSALSFLSVSLSNVTGKSYLNENASTAYIHLQSRVYVTILNHFFLLNLIEKVNLSVLPYGLLVRKESKFFLPKLSKKYQTRMKVYTLMEVKLVLFTMLRLMD